MKKSLHERIFFLRILNVLFTILCHSWGADNRYDEVIGDPVIRSPMGIKQFIWTPKIYILPIPKIWCYRRTVPLNCLGTRKFNSTDGVDYRLICTLFWSFYFPFRCPEIQACISSVLWCDGVRHCPSGFDEEEANCSYRFGVTLLYVAVGAGALGIFLILLLATGCLKYCLYRHKARKKKKTVALSVNHLHVNHTHHNNGLTGSRLSGRYNLATPQEMYLENYGKDSICWQYAIADIETTVWIVRMLLPVFMFVFLLFVFLHSFFSKKHCENKKNNKKKNRMKEEDKALQGIPPTLGQNCGFRIPGQWTRRIVEKRVDWKQKCDRTWPVKKKWWNANLSIDRGWVKTVDGDSGKNRRTPCWW